MITVREKLQEELKKYQDAKEKRKTIFTQDTEKARQLISAFDEDMADIERALEQLETGVLTWELFVNLYHIFSWTYWRDFQTEIE